MKLNYQTFFTTSKNFSDNYTTFVAHNFLITHFFPFRLCIQVFLLSVSFLQRFSPFPLLANGLKESTSESAACQHQKMEKLIKNLAYCFPSEKSLISCLWIQKRKRKQQINFWLWVDSKVLRDYRILGETKNLFNILFCNWNFQIFKILKIWCFFQNNLKAFYWELLKLKTFKIKSF